MPPDRRAIETPTILMLAATYAVWAVGTLVWGQSAVVSVLLTGVAIAQFLSLQHEALHDHPFANRHVNEALVFPALAVFVPYRRFRTTHLQHHHDPALTDPYDDPESNYVAPQDWAKLSFVRRFLLRVNNTLLGRIVVGPVLGLWAFVAGDVRLILGGNRRVLRDWGMNFIGLAPVVVWLSWAAMPAWGYALAIYLAMALLKIRTFLEHRAHEAHRARTVVIEDRGPLALLFLNNNFHVVHHMHPAVPWYKLPQLYAERKAHYLRRNDGYRYRSYAQVFAQYLLRAKDPVPHPVWPVRKDGRDEA
jgi:fatty acid desaturase